MKPETSQKAQALVSENNRPQKPTPNFGASVHYCDAVLHRIQVNELRNRMWLLAGVLLRLQA